MPLSTWIFLNCSSAFLGPAALAACGTPADCAFATPITTPPTARNAIIPKASARFPFINGSLIHPCIPASLEARLLLRDFRGISAHSGMQTFPRAFRAGYCIRTYPQPPPPRTSPAKAHRLLPSRRTAQTRIPGRSHPSPAASPHRSNRFWAHPQRSNRTTLKSSVPPPDRQAGADKTAMTPQTPGRHRSSPCPPAASAPRSPLPAALTKDRDQIAPEQGAPPPETPPIPPPAPRS